MASTFWRPQSTGFGCKNTIDTRTEALACGELAELKSAKVHSSFTKNCSYLNG